MPVRSLIRFALGVPIAALIALTADGSQSLSGHLTAEHACQGFVQLEPGLDADAQYLQIGRTYALAASDRPIANADWLQIVVPGAVPPLRWVPRGCGEIALTGQLSALHGCQAYLSSERLDNPDARVLTIGEVYDILEGTADWLNIRMPGAEPEERWVPSWCGTIRAAPDTCRIPDTEDGFVLALTWQPAFCEDHADRPECMTDNVSRYEATHFTLHGLWPDKREPCGIDYGFCGEIAARPPGGFCDYPPVPELSDGVAADLAEVMPSVHGGSCLHRHEWWKHGSCTGWGADRYYRTAARLTREFNTLLVTAFMTDHIGGEADVATFFDLVDVVFGRGSRNAVSIVCFGANLGEVRIALPADIGPDESLAELLDRLDLSSLQADSDCEGGVFAVDAIGQ